MHATSACPLRVATVVWQPRPGSFALTVVCKATFPLVPGPAPLAPTQDEPHAVDVPWSDEPHASLRHARDLVPFKRRADVLLVGHAYAPGGQPVTALVARLVAAGIDKEIAVEGDRFFAPDGRLGDPAVFASMPLRWERAAGGPDTVNPVGVRLDGPPDRLGRVPIPNLLPPGAHVESRGDTLVPVGFGPVAPRWPGRVAHLRKDAAGWDPAQWHERPLPEGLDAGYFNAAPPDQQTNDIPPHVRLVLTNLHREHARLVTTLSPIVPRAVCSSGSAPPHEVRLRCDTLCIDTDRAVVTLVWRGVVPLEHPAQAGEVVVTSSVAKSATTAAIDLASLNPGVALPFARGPAAPSVASVPTAPAPPVVSGVGKTRDLLGTTGVIDASAARAALPFAVHAREGAQAQAASPPVPIVEAAPAPLPPAPPREPAIIEPVGLGVVLDRGAPSPAPTASVWARGGAPSALVTPIAPIAPVTPIALAQSPAVVPLLQPIRLEATAQPARATGIEPLQLVWFEREIVPVVRKDPRWSLLFDELDERALDADLDDPDLSPDVADLDERREVFEVLARGSAVGEEGVMTALAGGVRSDGGFGQPLVLITGELLFPFDELEALKAMMSAAAPYAAADLEARAMLTAARDFLGSPGQPSAPAVAEGLTTRIRETFEKRNLVPAGFLDGHAARALLRGRHHQRRRVLGAPHRRAVWSPGAGPGVPVYLDRRAAAKLPATDRIRARLLAYVHPSLEQNETHAAALRVVALAVVNAPLARR